jgi:tetratricopeptide (TPR) repeat protein
MKKIAVFTFVLLGIVVPANADEELANLVKKIKPAVVLIETFDSKGQPVGQGSGFFVDKGRIITNHHVIEGAYSAMVKTINGKQYPVLGITAKDVEADIVKLAVNILQPKQDIFDKITAEVEKIDVNIPDFNIVPLKLSKVVPSVGEDVLVIGSPLGLEASVSTGIVSAVRDIPDLGNVIQITAAVSPGSSGSPVLNKKGEVVGIATFIASAGQNLNFAMPAEKILALKDSTKSTQLEDYAFEPDPNSAEILYYRGLKELIQEKWELALSYFQKVIAKNPKHAEAYFFIGVCYDNLGHPTKAIETCKQAIRIKPEYAEAYNCLGVAYGKLGLYQDAVEAFKQAIRIKPDYADAHYNLGNAYGELGRYQEAMDASKQAIRIKPDYADAHCNLGTAYYSLGRYQDAIEAYKQAIRIKPDYANAHYNLGNAYLVVGDKGSALEEYKILKTLDSELANKLFNLIYE